MSGRLLFAFLGAPVLWTLHLAVSYFLVTLDCATAWDGGGWAVALATVVFASSSASAGWTAWRLWRRSGQSDPDEREWTRFVLVGGMAGSALFTVVIVVEGMAPYFVRGCG